MTLSPSPAYAARPAFGMLRTLTKGMRHLHALVVQDDKFYRGNDRWEALGERWFGNLCYFDDIRKALTDNPHAALDAHTFGEVFEGMLDAFGNWDQVTTPHINS